MKAEDFDRPIEELRALANKRFELAQTPLEEPPHYLDEGAKLRLLLEAQFYLTAVARKEDERVGSRDYKLEVWVIVLIGIEIILSIVGIWIGIREGNQQARVLSNIEQSTKNSAQAMLAAKSSLETLASSQTNSLGHLKQMDSSLQSSQTTTAAMASATRKQLQILQAEQASRASQLARKPNLKLYVAGVPANGLTVSFKPRSETDTLMSFDFELVNEGNAIATKPLMRVVVDNKQVLVQSTTPLQTPVESPDSPTRVFLLPLDNIRPRVHMPMTFTFTYPANSKSFGVGFNVDADEIEAGTFLGTISVNPRHFPIQ
jgi:hypothetical protein